MVSTDFILRINNCFEKRKDGVNLGSFEVLFLLLMFYSICFKMKQTRTVGQQTK